MKKQYPNAKFSFIAHSFGTYILAQILSREFDFTAHRVIFCGSVVRYNFPFEQVADRFSTPILNEVGTRDAWPAIAESVTWGYGSAGTYGFRRPRVRDRWHAHAGHGYFLDAKFCRRYWIPFLKDGTIVEGAINPEPPPVWLKLASVIQPKYAQLGVIAVVLASLVAIFGSPRLPEAQVSTPCQGRIYAVRAKVGDFVKKGQVLFEVECPDVLHAESTLVRAANRLEETERNLSRLRELAKTQAVSEQELQQAVSDEQAAESDYREAQDAIRYFSKSVVDVDRIVANRAPDPSVVVPSPINGRIIASTAALGLVVQPGVSPPLFTATSVEEKASDQTSKRQ